MSLRCSALLEILLALAVVSVSACSTPGPGHPLFTGPGGSTGIGGSSITGTGSNGGIGATGTGGIPGSIGPTGSGGAGIAGTTTAGSTGGAGGFANPGLSVIGACDPSNFNDRTCLPPEPVIPTGCVKVSAPRKVTPAPNDKSDGSTNALVPEAANETLDNALIVAALGGGHTCVELIKGGSGANAFLVGPLELTSGQTLVIDEGVAVYASRNPTNYGSACVVIDPTGAVADTSVPSDASYDCGAIITATGDHVAIMGKGTIDGQGGEPLIGVSPPTKNIDTVANPSVPAGSFSWWNVSDFQRHDSRATGSGPGSAPNPALIAVSNASNFVLYGLNLYNSPFFHVQLNSDKFVVWGINLLTPSNSMSTGGQALSNFIARNTDGIDPGAATGVTRDGFIVGNRVSTGDDMVALKGNAEGGANNVVIAHNHFGTGHGMSLGSATIKGITNIHVYDLTVDGDVPVDANTGSSDLVGVRVKSYAGNGGFVKNVVLEDICTRDEVYPILITASYDANPLINPLGVAPDFQNIVVRNFHQLNLSGPQHPFETTVSVEGDTAHRATVTFDNVYVETSTGKKGGPVLSVASTAILTGTMHIGPPPSNDPCVGKTWWPALPIVP